MNGGYGVCVCVGAAISSAISPHPLYLHQTCCPYSGIKWISSCIKMTTRYYNSENAGDGELALIGDGGYQEVLIDDWMRIGCDSEEAP